MPFLYTCKKCGFSTNDHWQMSLRIGHPALCWNCTDEEKDIAPSGKERMSQPAGSKKKLW